MQISECTATLSGISPLSYSKVIESERNPGEGHDAFESARGAKKMHVKDGEVFIPPMALKGALETRARFLSEKRTGQQTWTKHFASGIMVVEPMMLGVSPDDVQCEKLFVPSDGKRGGSKRVWKHFPIIHKWETTCSITLLDPVLVQKPEKVLEYLIGAGQFVGFLRFRVERSGYYGRFTVSDWKVKSV